MSQFGARRQLAIQPGVMIKVGSSFRPRDVLPEEITRELAGLQDEVPAEDPTAIRQVVESEFGQPLQEKSLEFEAVPWLPPRSDRSTRPASTAAGWSSRSSVRASSP
jgi:predicted unusual protein kinase regulating ubiquinone biosynthesis (AarF/ABC1/UbiB family)